MKVITDSRKFKQEMNNIMEYSFGFLEGIQRGKTALYQRLGPQISEYASEFIDANARVAPQLLHHVYEWQQVGSPKARLFDISFTISNVGLTFKTSFKQSMSIKNGSNVPFYNKAEIMEKGIAVTIEPKKANVLHFQINGEDVFTKNPVVVENPGGQTQGQFENIINNFFGNYFRQSFLKASGLQEYFKYPKVYRQNLNAGKFRGRSAGISTGYHWVANAGVIK